MQGESDTLTVLLQLQGLDSYLECMLTMFLHPDSIIEVLVPAQDAQLTVSRSQSVWKLWGGKKKQKKKTVDIVSGNRSTTGLCERLFPEPERFLFSALWHGEYRCFHPGGKNRFSVSVIPPFAALPNISSPLQSPAKWERQQQIALQPIYLQYWRPLWSTHSYLEG